MENILTIDCEEWYHTNVFQSWSQKQDEGVICQNNICQNVRVFLRLFEQHDVSATFFILGCIAKKHPYLVNEIMDAGHNIGSHGYYHENVHSMGKKYFENQIIRCHSVFADLMPKAVVSFRAPNWSINASCFWAFEVLRDHGYIYDSSLKSFSLLRHQRLSPGLIEIPRSGNHFLRVPIPLGGVFLRVYPFDLIHAYMKKLNKHGYPFMIYLHPWEIDPDIPSIKTSLKGHLILYHNTRDYLQRIQKLLQSFRFTSIEAFFSREPNRSQFKNQLHFAS